MWLSMKHPIYITHALLLQGLPRYTVSSFSVLSFASSLLLMNTYPVDLIVSVLAAVTYPPAFDTISQSENTACAFPKIKSTFPSI